MQLAELTILAAGLTAESRAVSWVPHPSAEPYLVVVRNMFGAIELVTPVENSFEEDQVRLARDPTRGLSAQKSSFRV